MKTGRCIINSPRLGRKLKPQLSGQPELVQKIHAEHQAGETFQSLQERYGYHGTLIRMAFQKLGLPVRAPLYKPNSGCFPKTMRRLSKAELIALAAAQKRVKVPAVIKTEWREWTMKKRQWFIRQIRAHLDPRHSRPPGPYSANVEPYVYGDANIEAWCLRKNDGKSSHTAGCKIKVSSQGLLWRDRVFFWVKDTGYVEGVRWTHDCPRPAAHRLIYEEAHGPLPPDCVVRHRDGNPNNLDPANLYAATRNEVARENQSNALTARSRARTAALLKLNSRKDNQNHAQFTNILGGKLPAGGRGRRGRAA
jgi:hypothetical protein